MATSGNIDTEITSWLTLRFKWVVNSQSVVNNTSNITVSVQLISTASNGNIISTANKDVSVSIVSRSNVVLASGSSTCKIGMSGNSTKTLYTKTFDVAHEENGEREVLIKGHVQLAVILDGKYREQASAWDYVVFDPIARYATITTYTVSKVDETSLKVNWGCDVSCDKIYYSLNGGGFVEASGYPNFYISGLAPNTSYKVKIRVRRTGSGFTTDSSAYTQTTYNYPHCNSAANFTIGNKLTLGFYNPLGRNVRVWLVLADGSEVGGDSINGTTLSGYNNSAWQNSLYSSIPNAKSGKYKVKVVYNDSITKIYDKGYTYSIKGTEVPTINGVTYRDTNTAVVAITGNNQHIVQNQSNLKIDYEKATPNYSAGSIVKYAFSINGVSKETAVQGGTVDLGKVNSSYDVPLTLTVTDSRGLTASKEIKISMLEHSEPTAMVTLERLNNYEDESYLTVDASISSVDGKNTKTIKYRYKLSGDEYSDFVIIPESETQTFSLDKRNIFVFNVVVTDAFGTKFDREFILYKGVFPLFIDTEKNAVGINEFPAEDEALRVAGGTAHFIDGITISNEAVVDYVVEQGTDGIWTYRKWHSGNVDMEAVVSEASATSNELVEIVIYLPFAVSKVKPYVTCLASGWALSRPPYFNVYGGNNVTDNCEELRLYYTADNSNSRTYYFAIQVKGTWK